MNKKALVASVASETGMKKEEIEKVLDTITSTIATRLSEKEEVNIVGFGAFRIATRPKRNGFDPRRREHTEYPERTYMFFKPGKAIHEAFAEQ